MSLTTAGQLECRNVRTAAELDTHLWIRRQVFVTEQGIFDFDDVTNRRLFVLDARHDSARLNLERGRITRCEWQNQPDPFLANA